MAPFLLRGRRCARFVFVLAALIGVWMVQAASAQAVPCVYDSATRTATIDLDDGIAPGDAATYTILRQADGTINWSRRGGGAPDIEGTCSDGSGTVATIVNTDVIQLNDTRAGVDDHIDVTGVDFTDLRSAARTWSGTGIEFRVDFGPTAVSDGDALDIAAGGANDTITVGTGGVALDTQGTAIVLTGGQLPLVQIHGGFGSDRISAAGGGVAGAAAWRTVDIDGESGRDVLTGGLAGDVLAGGIGDDTLEGGPGADTLLGETQNDTIRANDGEADVRIDGGNHTDTVYFDTGLETPANAETLIPWGQGDATPPTDPTALAASASETAVDLTWNASTDNVSVAGYSVYIDGGLRIASTTLTSAQLTGLVCETSYELGVEAFDTAGNRSGRATITAATSACPPPPAGDACSYDAASDVVTAVISPGGQATLVVSGGAVWFGTTPAACDGATTANTDTIVVNGASGSVETLVIDQSGGAFAPGATAETGTPEIEMTITLGDATDSIVVDGSSGPDTITIGSTGIGLNGDTDRDVVITTPLPSQITVRGHGGPNTISALGGSGTGTAYAGKAILYAGPSGDTITGGLGNDELYGGSGNDVITGREGADAIDGAGGNDNLNGNDGADQITGGTGADSFAAGAGDDVMHADDGQADTAINGAQGNDTVYYDFGRDPVPVATEIRIPRNQN
jgi:chitodextrinase